VLGCILKIEDSWKLYRIEQALKGIPGDKEGFIDIILRNKSTQPKRAYLFIKFVTSLLEPNSAAHQIITQTPDLLNKWNASVDWLQCELDRRAPTVAAYYTSTTWSPPSNEAVNGSFYLERSNSARNTLEKALNFRVDSVEAVNIENDDEISSEGETEDDVMSKEIISESPGEDWAKTTE